MTINCRVFVRLFHRYTRDYLNRADVQSAIHARMDKGRLWNECSDVLNYDFNHDSMLPLYNYFLNSTVLRVWVYSGNFDSVLPTTGTMNWIARLGRTVVKEWQPWTGESPHPQRRWRLCFTFFVTPNFWNSSFLVSYWQAAWWLCSGIWPNDLCHCSWSRPSRARGAPLACTRPFVYFFDWGKFGQLNMFWVCFVVCVFRLCKVLFFSCSSILYLKIECEQLRMAQHKVFGTNLFFYYFLIRAKLSSCASKEETCWDVLWSSWMCHLWPGPNHFFVENEFVVAGPFRGSYALVCKSSLANALNSEPEIQPLGNEVKVRLLEVAVWCYTGLGR